MVPNGWEIRPLADIALVTSGGTPSRARPEFWENGTIPWIRTTEVQNCILTPDDIQEYISEKGLKSSSAKLVPSGTVLLAMIGQGKTRGQVALLKFESTINQNCAAIIFDDYQEPYFYFNVLLSQYEIIRGMSNSAGQSNLSGALVKTIKVPVPPLVEQKKIAKILYAWDTAIEITEKLLLNSRKQKQSLIQRLLTGNDKFQEYDNEWSNYFLNELFDFKKGKGLSKGTLVSNGRKCILYGELYTRYGEVITHVVSRTIESDGFTSKSGDILIPSSTTTTGVDLANATALLEDGVLLGGDINVLRPKKKINSVFMAYLLTHIKKKDIASRAQGITIIHLYGSDLKTIKVFIPDSITEQEKIVRVLLGCDNEIKIIKQKLKNLKQEKKALMQQLLTGKRRVKVEEA